MNNSTKYFGLMMSLLLLLSSCNKDRSTAEQPVNPEQGKYPLSELALKIGNNLYHGKVDQETHTITVGAITDGATIEDVVVTLRDPKAVIAPSFDAFLDKGLRNTQAFTITESDGTVTSYQLILPKLVGPEGEERERLFFDDFNVDGKPDPEKWSLVRKGTSAWNNEMSESYDQVYVHDGILYLIGEEKDGTLLAGGIETRDKFSFTFGKVEVRARVTKSPNGHFPAIWMMPQKYIYKGWPNCGEIDIMEHIKQEPFIYQTIHTHYTYDLKIQNPSSGGTTTIDYTKWQVYGVEWTPDAIIFSINGKKTFAYPNLKLADEAEKKQWPFTKDAAFYLILNMGLGGDNEWPGPVDRANLPAEMQVDWVRVLANEYTIRP